MAKAAAKELFTPFLDNNGQIEASQFIRDRIAYLRKHITRMTPLPVIFDRAAATRGRLIPVALPVNPTKNDFDSGKCDMINNTAFMMGQIGLAVASFKNWLFIVGHNAAGWINYPNAKMSLYTKDETPSIKETPTPEDLFNRIWNDRTYYRHAVNDCSASVRREFLRLGHSVSPYSGDLCDDLVKAGLPAAELSTKKSLEIFKEPGLYVLQLLSPAKEIGVFNSRHLYWVVNTKEGKLIAISQAFNPFDKNGKEIFPVGACLQTREDLAYQISLKRKFRAIKIAEDMSI